MGAAGMRVRDSLTENYFMTNDHKSEFDIFTFLNETKVAVLQ